MNDYELLEQKTYATSAELAARFSYSKDYISRLAREGKVNARQVGRRWLIEENALRAFVEVTEVEKKKRAVQLRQQRKYERELLRNRLELPTYSKALPAPYMVFGQTVAVMLCGLIVGVLGLRVSGDVAAVGYVDDVIVRGVTSVYTQVGEQTANLIRSMDTCDISSDAFCSNTVF